MRLKAVQARRPFVLMLRWADGSRSSADLSGLVAASRPFGVFGETPEAFAAVRVINWGHGVGWENGLDYSAENLAQISAEQSADKGPREIREFQERFKLTNAQAGRLLGYKVSQIKNFRAGTSGLPKAVAIAIRNMRRDPTVFYAHARAIFRPLAKRKAGRQSRTGDFAPVSTKPPRTKEGARPK